MVKALFFKELQTQNKRYLLQNVGNLFFFHIYLQLGAALWITPVLLIIHHWLFFYCTTAHVSYSLRGVWGLSVTGWMFSAQVLKLVFCSAECISVQSHSSSSPVKHEWCYSQFSTLLWWVKVPVGNFRSCFATKSQFWAVPYFLVTHVSFSGPQPSHCAICQHGTLSCRACAVCPICQAATKFGSAPRGRGLFELKKTKVMNSNELKLMWVNVLPSHSWLCSSSSLWYLLHLSD